jgi:hypothetical protein
VGDPLRGMIVVNPDPDDATAGLAAATRTQEPFRAATNVQRAEPQLARELER